MEARVAGQGGWPGWLARVAGQCGWWRAATVTQVDSVASLPTGWLAGQGWLAGLGGWLAGCRHQPPPGRDRLGGSRINRIGSRENYSYSKYLGTIEMN